MINFCIKFLICFMKPEPLKKKDVKGTKRRQSEGRKNKKPDHLIPETPENKPEEKDENIINCIENAREWCHIEYSLLKDVLPTTELNVVTWGEAARVYIKGDSRSIKTAVINDLVWVYFEIKHKINIFNDEEIVRFKDSRIQFTFSQDIKKMMPSASNDWPKQFVFCSESNDGPRLFSEIRQVEPHAKYDEPSIKLDNYKMSRPENRSLVTFINVNPPDKYVETKLHNVTASLPSLERTLNLPVKVKVKKVSNSKVKNSDKKEKKDTQEDKNQLFIETGHLIGGKTNTCAERTEISPTLRYAAVFLSSSKILTDEQDATYVPFIVNIQAIEGLPMNIIRELNISKLFARYELANVLKGIETRKFPIQENIEFDETRVFFISDPEEALDSVMLMLRPSTLLLAEALLTRRLVVNIYGEVTSVEGEVKPCIFGDRPSDPFISNPGHEIFINYQPTNLSLEIFIGSASFNLIHLMKGYSVVEACSVLTSSLLSSYDPTCDFDEITNDLQRDEGIKCFLSRFTTTGVIPESMFLENNSIIKLKVKTTCQLTTPEDRVLLKTPQVSHRAMVIFNDNSCNEKVIDLIERSNQILVENVTETVLSSAQSVHFVQASTESNASLLSTRLSDCRRLNLTLQEISKKNDSLKTITTGFFVEHEQQSILVIEAMTYVIPPLMIQIQALLKSEDSARIVCDSSLFFTNRLYKDCTPANIFRVKLAEPLDDLLRTPSFYTKQNMAEESLQTLLLLDLLRRCRTLNCACVNQLFPTYKQLISFHKAFGVKESLVKTDFLNNETETTLEV